MASELESPIVAVKTSVAVDRLKYPSLLPVVNASNPPVSSPRRQPGEVITGLQRRLSLSTSTQPVSPNNGDPSVPSTSTPHSSIPLMKVPSVNFPSHGTPSRTSMRSNNTITRSQSNTTLDHKLLGGGILNYSTNGTPGSKENQHQGLTNVTGINGSGSYAAATTASQRRSRKSLTTGRDSHSNLVTDRSQRPEPQHHQHQHYQHSSHGPVKNPAKAPSAALSSHSSVPRTTMPRSSSFVNARTDEKPSPPAKSSQRFKSVTPKGRIDSASLRSASLTKSSASRVPRTSFSPPAPTTHRSHLDIPPVPPLPEQVLIGRHKQVSQPKSGSLNHHPGGSSRPNRDPRIAVPNAPRSTRPTHQVQNGQQLSDIPKRAPQRHGISMQSAEPTMRNSSSSYSLRNAVNHKPHSGARKVSRVTGPRMPSFSSETRKAAPVSSSSVEHVDVMHSAQMPVPKVPTHRVPTHRVSTHRVPSHGVPSHGTPIHGQSIPRSNTFHSIQSVSRSRKMPSDTSPSLPSPLSESFGVSGRSPVKSLASASQTRTSSSATTFIKPLTRNLSEASFSSMSSLTSMTVRPIESTSAPFTSNSEMDSFRKNAPVGSNSNNTNKPWMTGSGRSSLASLRSSNSSMSNMAATFRMMLSPFSRQSRRSNASQASVSKPSTPSSSSIASGKSKHSALARPRSVYIPLREPSDAEMDEIKSALLSLVTTKPDSGSISREFEVMKRETPSLVAVPLTPAMAVRRYKLNMYEKGEILDYKEVYFCGRKDIQKVPGELQKPDKNYNFDDKTGNYKIVIGDHIAYRYRIMAVLGMGSFGKVLHCVDHKTGQFVAVKMIINSKQLHVQALVEVELLKTLSELNLENKFPIINYVEHFTFRDHLCISTELLGINLYELIKFNNYKGLPACLVKHFTRQMVQALAFLDSRKIIHCDLKPENVLISDINTGSIKLIDLGGSCYENEKIYTYIQSRFYRSPEIMLGMSYNTKVDIWSLGCILPELLTGKPLFAGVDEQEQVAYIIEMFGPPDPVLISRYSRRRTFFDAMGNPKDMTVKRHGSKERRLLRPYGKNLERDFFKSSPDASDASLSDFLRKLLTWDPQRRLGAIEALDHPYLASEPQSPDVTVVEI